MKNICNIVIDQHKRKTQIFAMNMIDVYRVFEKDQKSVFSPD